MPRRLNINILVLFVATEDLFRMNESFASLRTGICDEYTLQIV
jgi:hypothetical protein